MKRIYLTFEIPTEGDSKYFQHSGLSNLINNLTFKDLSSRSYHENLHGYEVRDLPAYANDRFTRLCEVVDAMLQRLPMKDHAEIMRVLDDTIVVDQ